MDKLSFSAAVLEWRGPAPHYFLPVPAEHVPALREAGKLISYGWGVLPATVEIAGQEYYTALFPRQGGYLVPLRAVVRRAQGLQVGDTVDLTLRLGRGEKT